MLLQYLRAVGLLIMDVRGDSVIAYDARNLLRTQDGHYYVFNRHECLPFYLQRKQEPLKHAPRYCFDFLYEAVQFAESHVWGV